MDLTTDKKKYKFHNEVMSLPEEIVSKLKLNYFELIPDEKKNISTMVFNNTSNELISRNSIECCIKNYYESKGFSPENKEGAIWISRGNEKYVIGLNMKDNYKITLAAI